MCAADRRTHRTVSGFTLIEVLVVLVIVGVVVAGVTLSVGGQSERELENAALRARALIELACERAELGGRDIGFAALQDGLRFGYVDPDGWKAVPSDAADELRQRALGEAITLHAERDGDLVAPATATGAAPPFACLSSGELTPFALEIERVDVDVVWRLEGRLDGSLELASRVRDD